MTATRGYLTSGKRTVRHKHTAVNTEGTKEDYSPGEAVFGLNRELFGRKLGGEVNKERSGTGRRCEEEMGARESYRSYRRRPSPQITTARRRAFRKVAGCPAEEDSRKCSAPKSIS